MPRKKIITTSEPQIEQNKQLSIADILSKYPDLGKTNEEEEKLEPTTLTRQKRVRKNPLTQVPKNMPKEKEVEVTQVAQAAQVVQEAAPITNKKVNPWLEHVKVTRESNPGKSYRECLVLAKSNYVKAN